MIYDHVAQLELSDDSVSANLELLCQERVDVKRAAQFVQDFARRLLRSESSRRFPELVSLGFFFRNHGGESSQVSSEGDDKMILKVPRGLVFHIPPANVDTVFLYSWILALLAGNANIVRVSDRLGDAARFSLSLVGELLRNEYEDLSASQRFLTIARESEAIALISNRCDMRVIWGGNQSIDAIRRHPLSAHAIEMTFPDRNSFCCVSAFGVSNAAPDELRHLAEKFINDVWWFDQAACSSPRQIFWIGSSSEIDIARDLFFKEVAEVLGKKSLGASAAQTMERFSNLVRLAMLEESTLDLGHVGVGLIETGRHVREWTGVGSFVEHREKTLDAVARYVRPSDQTLTYFGFRKDELKQFATRVRGAGIDRIVPIGDALSFSEIWDGYHLPNSFVRLLEIR